MKTIISLLLIIGLSGCATKGARKIYAKIESSPSITSPKQEYLSPNRTKPGELMDPQVQTFTQIPTRIIYLPGGQTLFSRTSPSQSVAYQLNPLESLLPPPLILNTEKIQEEKSTIKEVFTTAFLEEDGSESHGTARRLGILGKSAVEKERASLMLNEKETLKWSADAGWVGFRMDKKTKPIATKQPPMQIDETPAITPIEKPLLETITNPAPKNPAPKNPEPKNPEPKNNPSPSFEPKIDTGLEINF